jgi:thiamine biosynthesis lipoprotein
MVLNMAQLGKLLMVAALITGLLVVSGCREHPGNNQDQLVEVDSGQWVLMGTFARIQLRCDNQEAGDSALASAREALEQVDHLMSTYRTDSELSEVNRRAAQEPVPVSAETFRLLQNALEISAQTHGAFDITVPPLIRVWKQAARENRFPTEDELAEAKTRIGYEKVQLSSEHKTVSFACEGMELNVDAIAKGYAVDCALAAVRSTPGVRASLVDIGGEIACFGQNAPDKDWLIGIQDPFADDTDNPLSRHPRWRIRLRDAAVATSGNYRSYVNIKGEKLSHIIDPRNGRPATKLPSVTIIADTCEKADALATAVSVLGAEKGMELIETQPDTEAFLVAGTADDPVIYRSRGFEKYEVSN